MTLPTFMILGAAKAGTTSLCYYLERHPEVFMSHPRGPVFFEAEYELGAQYYSQKYFAGYSGQQHVGEAGHHLIPFVLPRIAATIDNVKFLVIVRHPVERAYSHYWHLYSRGEDKRSFENVVAANLRRLQTGPFFKEDREVAVYARSLNKFQNSIEYPLYIDMGCYAEQIKPYIERFGHERVKVLFFEDLAETPDVVVREVLAFLDLAPIEALEISPQNQPLPPAIHALIRYIGAVPVIKRVPHRWREAVKRIINSQCATSKPPMSPVTRNMLVDYFKPHVEELEKLTGRNLGDWKR